MPRGHLGRLGRVRHPVRPWDDETAELRRRPPRVPLRVPHVHLGRLGRVRYRVELPLQRVRAIPRLLNLLNGHLLALR